MTGFCVKKIASDERLRPVDGVLHSDALTLIADARALGERIVQEAREQAEGILSQARARAGELERTAEQQVFERASGLLDGLNEAGAAVADRVSQTVVDLVMDLLGRLLLQVTPRERVEAVLKRLRQEAPTRLVDAVLRVHPEDVELLPEVDWEIKRDETIPRGACRLEAASGEWYADFDAAVQSLRAALDNAVKQPSQEADEEDDDADADADADADDADDDDDDDDDDDYGEDDEEYDEEDDEEYDLMDEEDGD